MKKILAFLLAITLLVQPINNYKIQAEEITEQYENKFVPADGKTLVFIGQDDNEVADYIEATETTPAGMMIYTNIGDLSAMTTEYQGEGANQAGKMDFQAWTTNYDNTALNLAIWASNTSWLQGIINGQYDDNIKRLASFLKSSDKPIYVRFGYEFDGPWNAYQPELYKKAYKHFVDVIRDTTIPSEYHYGVGENISFVWHSAAFFRLGENAIWPDAGYNKESVENYLANPSRTLEDWYPGDEYVDWVGISWFAWDHKFQETAASIRRDEAVAFAKEHNKPVMIAEAAPKANWQPNNPIKGCCDDGKTCVVGETDFVHTGDSWDNWYQPMFNYIEENDIKALCYINQDWNAQEQWRLEGGWGDSRVQMNEEVQDKWLKKLNEPRYIISSNSLYSQIGYTPINKTQDIKNGIKVTEYSAKAENGSNWCIQDYPEYIGFNGQYTWAEYNIKVNKPGYYKVIYDYISGLGSGSTLNVFINGVQQDTTINLPFTDASWVKSSTAVGQIINFQYKGNYTILFQSPSAGLNLKGVTFEETQAPKPTGIITIHGKDDLSSDSQNITVSYGAFASFGAPSKAIYHFEVEEAGNYQLIYNYGTTINSKYKFYLDGKIVEDSTMAATGDWTIWKEKQGPDIYLNQGTHTVSLESPNGSLNLQYIKFILKKEPEEDNTDSELITKQQQTITVNKTSYTKTKGSKAFYLGAKAKTTLTYKSSNPKVVTVNNNGKVNIKGYGKAIITIKANESTQYKKATKKISIVIKPKKVTKVTVKHIKSNKFKKSYTVKWKKDSTVTGYQVQYATNSKFTKGVKTIRVKSNKKTIKLAKKKTYYVRVRSYVKIKGGKIYGAYSKSKKIKG